MGSSNGIAWALPELLGPVTATGIAVAGQVFNTMHSLANMSKKVPAWSREFDTLIRAIGECKSKAEEDQIIQREVEVLKPRLKAPSIEKKALKELLVRLLYVEMLGHDASWGHVKALQACSEGNLLVKKVRPCLQRLELWWCKQCFVTYRDLGPPSCATTTGPMGAYAGCLLLMAHQGSCSTCSYHPCSACILFDWLHRPRQSRDLWMQCRWPTLHAPSSWTTAATSSSWWSTPSSGI